MRERGTLATMWVRSAAEQSRRRENAVYGMQDRAAGVKNAVYGMQDRAAGVKNAADTGAEHELKEGELWL